MTATAQTAPVFALERVLSTPARHCPVCERSVGDADVRCRNPLCASVSRWFRRNVSVTERRGELERALDDYKYGGVRSWVPVFGRMLAAFLEARSRLLDTCDLVVASPTFVGRGGRDFDHTRSILIEAARQLPPHLSQPFDLGPVAAIVKTGPTPRLAGLDHGERRRVAEEHLRPVLRVSDSRRTAGRRILVIDDVFTDGRTLDEVARALRLQGGAREVSGVALSRQPWRARTGHEAPAA